MVAQVTRNLVEMPPCARRGLEAIRARMGLVMLDAILCAQIARKTSPRGRQLAYRHGSQPDYVFGGRRIAPLKRPQLRGQGAGDLSFETPAHFQRDRNMQRAVPARPRSRVGPGTLPHSCLGTLNWLFPFHPRGLGGDPGHTPGPDRRCAWVGAGPVARSNIAPLAG